VGFLLAALAARLIYPSLSLEGKSFWVIRSSPLQVKRILGEKLILGFVPLVIVAEVLAIFSNLLLKVDPFLVWLSLGTVFFLSLGLSTLAVGIGALYPKFEAENPAQIATSIGGIIYMLFGFIFVVLVLASEAWPVYLYFQARLKPDLPSLISISVSLLFFLTLNSLIVFLPLKLGARALKNGEY
jgi:ABC-2 type transport system permease protein